eukprot:Skav203615  [mRNA]  locus=scaffold935:508255:512939:- [translate_table: standard]
MDWRMQQAVCLVREVGLTTFNTMVGSTPVILHLPSGWGQFIEKEMKITVCNFKVTWYEGEIHFHCDPSAGGVILVHANATNETGTIVEAFSGLGGWSNAVTQMGAKVHMMIEKDVDTARVCACQYDIPVYTAQEYIDTKLSGKKVRDCVINDSMASPTTWMAIGLANPQMILASPPCQPWSGAGNAAGTQNADGMLMLSTLGWAGKMGIQLVLIENVPGICKHADYPKIIEEAKQDGMILVHANTFSCHQVLPVRRDRWLAIFRHCTVDVDSQVVQSAAAVSFSCPSLRQVCCQPSLSKADAIHVNMHESEKNQLRITDEMMQAMKNPRYAPVWLQHKAHTGNPDDLFRGRSVTSDSQLSAVMAMYGSQHTLSDELLSTKGLHTMIFVNQGEARLFSPWELVAAQGYTSNVVLHQNMQKSWALAGNGITVAHAWLALTKAHMILQSKSPFKPVGSQSQQIQKFMENALKLKQCETVIEGDFWMVVAKEKVEPEPKKLKATIPPTCPFMAEEGELQSDVEPVLSTKKFGKAPEFQYHEDARHIAVIGDAYTNGIVLLQHCQNHWMMFLNAAAQDTVGTLIQKGLPHAKANHFEWVTIDDVPVEWNHLLQKVAVKTMRFAPTMSLVVCAEQSLQIAINLQCDVTWTTKTAIAYCASKLGCNPDTVLMRHDGLKMKEDDFLLEFEGSQFQIEFQAKTPAYVDLAPVARQSGDPGIQPAPTSFLRIYARHPLKKTTRTIAIPIDCTVGKMVQMMFPDLHATTPWTPFSEGEVIPTDTFASAWTQIVIQWDTLRPLRTTEVCAVMYKEGIDSPVTQASLAVQGIKRFMKSPFEVKPKQYRVHPNMQVGDVAATYLCHSQIQANMLCIINGLVVDPITTMAMIDENATMDFRLCPLLGGAKHDACKKRIHDMLVQKGVPTDMIQERLSAFLAKCPVDKLVVYKDDNDDDFWDNIKKKASEAKFRLIKPDELKAHQQKQKQQRSSSSNAQVKKEHTKQAKGNKQPRPNVHHQPGANEVVVDAGYFTAEGSPVKLLEADRMGPDQSGLCIVTAAQASKFTKEPYKSCDPLALLVVGQGAEQFGPVFTLPTHTLQGAPTITTASLVQFGDISIDFVLKIPKITVAPTASTVIEFTIERQHVSQWSAATIPLHYLGVHIPPLRGSNLLAVWSVKAWKGKAPSNAANASHWHGFFRIQDDLLSQVLKRSGTSGIFLWPKSANKKHDARYIVIPMAAGSLKDIMTKAEACKEAMGVTKMGDGFAIRCKREDASSVRSQVMPETAFVAMANINHDDTLYVMKHAPMLCREELSAALRAAGWEAEAVKSQGANRWVIASKTKPPSCHMAVNNTIVIIEPMHSNHDQSAAVIATASEYSRGGGKGPRRHRERKTEKESAEATAAPVLGGGHPSRE